MNTGSEGGINGIFFIDQTISRDVNERREEAGLLPRLNSKFDSLTLRLNSSQKPNQPAEESKVTSEFGRMFSGVGKGAPRIGDPGSVTAVAQQPYTDMNTGLALRGETDGLGLEPPRALGRPRPGMRTGPIRTSDIRPDWGQPPPTPRPPTKSKLPNIKPVAHWSRSWKAPPFRKKRSLYSTVKSSRSSKWRRNLQRNQGPIFHDKPRAVGDDVGNLLGDAGDTGDHSVATSRKSVEVNSLAESLSTLAERHLNLDVLDQSRDVSRFVSYLFDTIQMLEAELNYKDAGSERSVSFTGSDSDEPTIQSVPVAPCFRTLHRIWCGLPGHDHDKSLFEDEPVAKIKSASPLVTKVEATNKIENLDAYLNKHPQFCFIVIKEHTCVREPDEDASDRRSDATGTLSERSERLTVLSPLLRKALDQVAQYNLESSCNIVQDGISMDAPYPFLFHHRERLVQLSKDDAYGRVLSPLLEFLNENYTDEYEEAVRMFDRGFVNARHLQKLFQPNQLVILKTSEDLNVYALDQAPKISKEGMSFEGWSYFYTEVCLRQKMRRETMDVIASEDVQISNLKVHPFSFGRKEDIEKLTHRGQAFWKMKGQHYACYTGWDHQHDHCYNSARFMVDLATHHLMHPSNRSDIPLWNSRQKNQPWPERIKLEDEMTPEIMLLLPSTVYGFNLQDKKWVDLEVDKFHPVAWNKDAFKRLVLDEKTKEMIYALVDIQTATKRMDDIITGKGNGLIVLLHGSPGTGKTLTAESVAEIAEKPLYRVTCGDIGTEAQDVEKYLATVLYLGKLWDCVLLLDEADVFLEERTFADLQRNSLVSVFLRVLEYYEGILILTSNRVGHFDEAFKSRIQVAIHYENLSKKSRKAIWQNFLEMIEDSADEDANIAELEGHLDQLASEEMNGRQIRNALLTARQLAKHRKERLEWEHLDQVMKTSAAFNKYLKTIRGQSDDKLARDEGRR